MPEYSIPCWKILSNIPTQPLKSNTMSKSPWRLKAEGGPNQNQKVMQVQENRYLKECSTFGEMSPGLITVGEMS
jgi:CRISPR/Cas system CSM-associated protein Csm4 (group 5 of RAMP superfamily)